MCISCPGIVLNLTKSVHDVCHKYFYLEKQGNNENDGCEFPASKAKSALNGYKHTLICPILVHTLRQTRLMWRDYSWLFKWHQDRFLRYECG